MLIRSSKLFQLFASPVPAYCSFIQGMSSFVENILDDALARVWEADAAGAKEKSLSGKIVQADAHLLGSMVQSMLIFAVCGVFLSH